MGFSLLASTQAGAQGLPTAPPRQASSAPVADTSSVSITPDTLGPAVNDTLGPAVNDTLPFVLDERLARWFRVVVPGWIWIPQRLPNDGLGQVGVSVFSERQVRRDDGSYLLQTLLDGRPYGVPVPLDLDAYADLKLQRLVDEGWNTLAQQQRRSAAARQKGLLDFSLTIPGGRESAFTTIFGTPQVNLRVNGSATINVGASIQKSEDPFLPPDQQTRVDPTFDQNLQLNIQGTIGDKLTIQTDWDTERQFEFQNRLKIAYTGYEDEIIKSIEMGNVSMQTGNSLVRGGGSLFGIKSIVEMGPLKFTSIVSQQKGDSNVETISGGSQEQVIQIRPASYENDRHFFMDFYTRQQFEQSLANPQQLRQTLQLADVNVWLLKENLQTEEGARRAVALVDLGVATGQDGSYLPPANASDEIPDAVIEAYRDPTVPVSAGDLGVGGEADFETGFFSLLQEGVDYNLNKVTGTISMRRTLGAREVLAISFSYLDQNGRLVQVGDVNRGGSDRIFLKMIRPKNVSTDNKVFDLTMKNVYSLGVSGIQSPENLEIDIQFTEGNIAQNRLPGRSTTILQDLGLDRVDEQGALSPDNLVDFGTGTLDPAEGRLMFPYLEPFGSRLRQVLLQSGASDEDVDRLVYTRLYTERATLAGQDARNNFYRVEGVAKGGAQDNYNLGFALVEGSVRVTANGVELREGTDYQVDYTFGNISILNPRFTAPGQQISIEYENQAFTTIEQKSFTGLRAEYTVSPAIKFGGTMFRYNEKPLDDKIRIGDEPINNTALGFDATARVDAPLITRMVDAIPLIQTKAPSEISFSGEFAQLRPGVAQTRGTAAAIKRGDLFRDEEEGLSFIDDFEGANIKVSLLNATRWSLAASPAALPGYLPDARLFDGSSGGIYSPDAGLQARRNRSDLRSEFSWYSIPRNISSILGNVTFTPESRPIRVTDVFPGKETQNPQEEFLTTLDVHFDPGARGVYAYPEDLTGLYDLQPERTWGGMTAVLPSGQEDFTQNNIEFLEFWVQPILPGGQDAPAGEWSDYEGTLYLDLGILSEDVIPNARLNSEDGLAASKETLLPDDFNSPRSAIPSIPPAPLGQFSNKDRDIEDVGLDGLPNTGGVNDLNERIIFADFIENARLQLGDSDPRFQALQDDPSNDDYVYYGESKAGGLPLHERFHRMLGRPDGNTPLNQSEKRAVTNRPDTEGLINASIVEQNNSYYQYEIPLNPADASSLAPGAGGGYIVDRVNGPSQTDRWYLVRVPVSDFRRRYGDINSFQNISYARVWMSGYRKPFTLRFATFEFVGSQWREADAINNVSDPMAEIRISSINIEENGSRTPIPYRQPEGGIRAVNRGAQLQSLANEQSLVLQVEDLGPQGVQLVKKVIPGGLNLINYSNMRMFVHGEGFENRGDAELVVRLGSDLENNYYEYRQPVTPTDPNYPFQGYDPNDSGRMDEEAAQVWLYEENSMNLVLSAFNALKQLRDQLTTAEERGGDGVFESRDLLRDGVPGAVVAIKGNPSLTRISEIGLGIRNPYDPTQTNATGVPVLNAQMWFNELRVSGFDNRNGWAASLRASARLADVANLNTSLTRQTNGFGSIDSRLGQRLTSDLTSLDLSGSMSLHKFLPARFGWNIPLSVTARQSVSTPLYLPNQGDIRYSDFVDAVNARDDVTEAERKSLIADRLDAIQTVSESFSVNLSNVSKRDSKSPILKATLDNTSVGYTFNTAANSSPEYSFRDNRDATATARYGLQLRNLRMLTPLRFLEDTPVLKHVSGFQLGYLPTDLGASINGKRTYSEGRRRPQQETDPLAPLQQTHAFNYSTTFNIGYRPTTSIMTGFQSGSNYDLGLFSTRPAGFEGPDSAVYNLVPTFEVLKQAVNDTLKPRRSSYNETYTASWQPRFNSADWLSWITYSARYSGGFRWENSPYGSGLGARIGNTFRLDHTLKLDTGKLTGKLGFYKSMQAADAKETSERETLRKKKQTDASQRREARKQSKQEARESDKQARERQLMEERANVRARQNQQAADSADAPQPADARPDTSAPVDSTAAAVDAGQGDAERSGGAEEEVGSDDEQGRPEDEARAGVEQDRPEEVKRAGARQRRTLGDRLNVRTRAQSPQGDPQAESPEAVQDAPEAPIKGRQDGASPSDRIGVAKHARYVGRKLLMVPFGIKSIDLGFSQSSTGAQAGYTGGSQLAQSLFGATSPSFLYRIGVEDQILGDDFIGNMDGESALQLPSQLSDQYNLTAGTSFSPFKSISVDLNWGAQWDERISETLTIGVDDSRSTVRTSNGTITSSVWAFGKGYGEMFRSQLQRAFDDIPQNAASSVINDLAGNGDGSVVLTPRSLETDFRRAYLIGAGSSIDGKSFIPLPLPQWKVNWTGLEKSIPFLGRHMQRATLTHSYQARYRLGWIFNNDAGDSLSQSLGSYRLEFLREEFDPNSINIEQRFSPLLQMTISWKNTMRTTIGIESAKMVSLALSNAQVTEKTSKGVKVSFNYSIKDFKLPFLKKINNNVDLTLNGAYLEDVENRYQLGSDISQALKDPPSTIVRDPSQYSILAIPPTGQARINGSAVVGYRFSSTLQANAEYAYSRIIPRSSRTFERTTHDIRVNVRISIRSN